MFTTPKQLIEDERDNHPDDVIERAVEIAHADETWVSGKKPAGVAASAIYIAYKLERPLWDAGDDAPTQSDLADEFDTTMVTIRKRLDHLKEIAEE